MKTQTVKQAQRILSVVLTSFILLLVSCQSRSLEELKKEADLQLILRASRLNQTINVHQLHLVNESGDKFTGFAVYEVVTTENGYVDEDTPGKYQFVKIDIINNDDCLIKMSASRTLTEEEKKHYIITDVFCKIKIPKIAKKIPHP